MFLHPGIHKAVILHKSTDNSNMSTLCQGQATHRVDIVLDSETPNKTTEITRHSRIPFEVDPTTVLMEDLLRNDAADVLHNDE